MNRFVTPLMLSLALAGTTGADVVHLRNGRTLRDVAVRHDVKGLRVTLSTGSLLLNPDEILRIVHTPEPIAAPALASTRLRQLAAKVRAAYVAGHPQEASRLLTSHESAHSALDLPGHVSVSGTFDGLALRVSFRLRSADGPAVLALPPGTLALVTSAEGDAPLALLRAPVVVLDAETPSVLVTVPVAWARFWSRPEEGEHRVRFQAPSGKLARLAAALCSGTSAPAAAPAQLALWIAAEDIDREALVEQGAQVTCSRELVLPLHAAGAAEILRKADVPLRKLRFFRAKPLPELPAAKTK